MSEYVRKISLAKWKQLDIINTDDVSADAITICMKTQGNTLSVWNVVSEEHVDTATLAIIANQDRLETIHVVSLPEHKIRELNISIDPKDGDTPVSSLMKTHYNLSELTYKKLGSIAGLIVDVIRKNKQVRYTVEKQKEILLNAIEQGLLNPDLLKQKTKEQLYPSV